MKKPIKLNCPRCGAQKTWDKTDPYRPFCSASCKNSDFIAWANEDQVIAGEDELNDVMSEDLNYQH
ncbi:MAG: DNA gyrase inhibitor YacG [Pseudomonadales bacterium]